MAGSINPRALQKLFGQAHDVVSEQINRQRQAEGRMGDPKTGKRFRGHLAAVSQLAIGQPLI